MAASAGAPTSEPAEAAADASAVSRAAILALRAFWSVRLKSLMRYRYRWARRG